jgi:hypothetical protein
MKYCLPLLLALLALTSCQPRFVLHPLDGAETPLPADGAPAVRLEIYALSGDSLGVCADVEEILRSDPGPILEIEMFWGGDVRSPHPPGLYSFSAGAWTGPAGSGLPAASPGGGLSPQSDPGTVASLKAFLDNLVPDPPPSGAGPMRALMLIGEGEGRYAFGGISPVELADAVAADGGHHLVLLEGGFSASLEFCSEFARAGYAGALGAAPGPWPVGGRDYAAVLARLAARCGTAAGEIDPPDPRAAWTAMVSGIDGPDDGSVLIDSPSLAAVCSALEDLLAELCPALTECDPERRREFRDLLFHSDPAYYLCPGMLRIDAGFLSGVSGTAVFEDGGRGIGHATVPAAGSAADMADALADAVLGRILPGGADAADGSCGISLNLVPLYPSGQADPRFPEWYVHDPGAELQFLRGVSWAPVPDGSDRPSLLSLLWRTPD